jgi:adenylate cyclase
VDVNSVYRTNQADLTDLSVLLPIFSSIVRSSSLVSMAFAGEDGSMTGIRMVNNRYVLQTCSGFALFCEAYDLDIDTLQPIQFISNYSDYTPLDRPWYKAAVERGGFTWTPPFAASLTPDHALSMSVVVPFYNDTGFLLGVLQATTNLALISQFLANTEREENTVFIIVDTSGYVLGTSVPMILSSDISVDPQLVLAIKHQNNVIRRTAIEIMREYGGFDNFTVNETVYLEYGSGPDMRRISIRLITDPYGLEVVGIAVLKEDDIMQSVYYSNKISAVICAVSVTMTLVLAFCLGCIITKPLKQMCKVMDRVANMELSGTTKLSAFKLYELEEMTHSMDQMKLGLRNFEKFVPSSVVTQILRENSHVVLGVAERECTVMFADIKDFTAITETTDPNILVAIMQEFFGSMSDIIVSHDGVIDKYIGDAIMALFNAPLNIENHEMKAVSAAIEMQNKMEHLNAIFAERQYPQLHIRIGINTSTSLVGNIGSSNRVSYTAIGDGVNVAARCEALNKRYDTKIIIGPNTFEEVKGFVLCRWLTSVRLKGKLTPSNVYEVLGFRVTATTEQMILSDLHEQVRCFSELHDYDRVRELCTLLLVHDVNNIAARDMLDRLAKPDFSSEDMVLSQS